MRTIGRPLARAQAWREIHLHRWTAIPLRLIVGYGFMAHGFAKLAKGPDHFVAIVNAIGFPVGEVGGLASNNTGPISGSFATGDITGGNNTFVGGLAGHSNGTISASYAGGSITGGQDSTVGGLVGNITGSIHVTGSYASGDVSGGSDSFVGGFVGHTFVNATVDHDWASGNVTGLSGSSVGGFVGDNNGVINHAYSLGNASAGDEANVGGFAGLNDLGGTIDESYSSGTATGGGQANIGGFLGENNSTSALTISAGDYYNTVGNSSSGVGLDVNNFTDDVSGVNMSAPPHVSDFSEWSDFGTSGGDSGWVIVDADGSLNNAGDANGATLPMLLTEYTTTIANGHQLQLMELDTTTNYTLHNNIDASATGNSSGIWHGGTGFVSVSGNGASVSFTGTFDGAGHTIAGLTMNDGNAGLSLNGMFGYLGSGSIVKNLTLTGASLVATDYSDSGILAGDSVGTISGVFVSGTYSHPFGGAGYFGGLVGGSLGGTIQSSGANVSMTFSSNSTGAKIGGLAGYSAGTISDSHATGSVAGTDYSKVGGLVGELAGGTIDGSYATGAVSGGDNAMVGGLVGLSDAGTTISNSHATGDVTATTSNTNVGGLVGENGNIVETSYATGNVSGGHYAGGLIGDNDVSVTTSYATGSVTGGEFMEAGGLVGNDDGSVTYSYATGNVTAGFSSSAGGVVGYGGTVSYSYATGAIAGATYQGGISAGGTNVSHSYWDTDTTGQAQSGGNTNEDASTYGLSDTNMRDSTKLADFNFNTDWVIVDADSGGVDNVGGAAGGTTPMLLSEYSTTITNAHQLQLIALHRSANYTLANDIDASGTAGGDVWDAHGYISQYYFGTFDGAGHSIVGLTQHTGNAFAGLIADLGSSGVVENVALTGADINMTVTSWAGILVAISYGTVTRSSASGTISGAGDTGGLVGQNLGTITLSSSSANVSDGNNSGGLVGLNFGSISQSYATGSVLGDSSVGGFVGMNDGAITQSYATGSTSGGGHSGGFVGTNNTTIDQSYSLGVSAKGFAGEDAGGITNSYWDTDTSGTTQDASAGGVTGETTTQLQAALPSGFDGSVWNIIPGQSFAYLSWQFANGTPVVVSGTAYSDDGVTKVGAGEGIDLFGNGGSTLGSLSTFADGSFYTLLGSMPSTGVLAQGEGGSAFSDAATATGLQIFGSGLNITTGDANVSTLAANIAAAQGSAINFGTVGDLSIASTSDFDVDQSLNVGAHHLTLTAAGALALDGNLTSTGIVELHDSAGVTQNSGIIAANELDVFSSAGNVTLNGANNIATLGTVEANGGGDLSVTDAASVTLADYFSGTNVSLTTTGAGQGIVNNGTILASGILTLNSAGAISSVNGGITAATLTGSSNGAATLTNSFIHLTNLGAFTTGGNNAFSLTDAQDLTVNGAVNAGTGALTLTTTGAGSDIILDSTLHGGTVTLASAASISSNGSGAIAASTLTGSSHGAVALNAANIITNLGAFTTGGNNAFSLTDAHDLTVAGAVAAGTGALTLTTTGAGDDIILHNTLHGGTVKLASAATISANSAGKITAATLTGAAHGAVSLAAANTITNLGAFSTGGNNAFALTDAHDLTVNGAVNAGTAGLTLTTAGTGDDILVDSTLHGGIVKLVSAGKITANANGKITAATLIGSSHGAVSLAAANAIANLGAFSTGGNNAFALTDAGDLSVTGAVNAGTGGLTLKTTGPGHDLAIKNVLTGGTAVLTSAGTIVESGSGVIHAAKLTGSSAGGASLAGANLIATLGNFANTGAGNFSLKDGKALTVSGTVSVASTTGTLALTTTVGNLTINGSLKAPTVTLNTAGEVLEGNAGSVTATKLLNVTAKTGIDIDSTHNQIKKIGTRHTNSGPNVINGIGQ